jgi:glyoxylate reductase
MPEEALALIRQEHQVESYAADPPLDRQKLLESVADNEGLLCTITDRIDIELLACAKALKVIANFGVGFEHIDLAAATPASTSAGLKSSSVVRSPATKPAKVTVVLSCV